MCMGAKIQYAHPRTKHRNAATPCNRPVPTQTLGFPRRLSCLCLCLQLCLQAVGLGLYGKEGFMPRCLNGLLLCCIDRRSLRHRGVGVGTRLCQ